MASEDRLCRSNSASHWRHDFAVVENRSEEATRGTVGPFTTKRPPQCFAMVHKMSRWDIDFKIVHPEKELLPRRYPALSLNLPRMMNQSMLCASAAETVTVLHQHTGCLAGRSLQCDRSSAPYELTLSAVNDPFSNRPLSTKPEALT
ncbi:hypothetical protein CLAFUW4_03275 [Fulvia fulva]|uniref:Uncharacterized protein n=1 Tax=Passalora fulva TaxID=5499 RepID=A0A9Q8LBQ2_PASFU|nr:uncharacterized protein CLAFUR5_03256 [Fulvia fulva]KAK4631399.1 hypothetical protein CLAFUR4_03264 [Fulvia fulva]KAK4632562.1 hypothetical protein CLAFUR0_03268 [Fulvia fulva]UJO14304.1 hypothetical protein CLAFUR5_03256 [Fulvia fulva]WPV11962.1 hypothetical protein CLAFUW4_03275 [Fulvia fulva]WPV25539.1 hypothetical protein CLAFUW7_03268 [Fulvia fulva]